ncbi:MAG: sigma-70 family RNA polymerase sigma factor [Pseudomonadota bacterium]
MAAVPDRGRATRVEPPVAPEATATQDLYERFGGQILGFCLQRLGSREEAEDAVQQTFLNAFRGLRRGIVPEAEAAWLFKIAENVCLTRRRSSSRRGKVESPGDIQALQDFVAAPQRMGTDELIQLQDALATMPATQRRAILLREWQGLSYREIAAEMELSQPAVETLIFRARRSLAEGLERPPAQSSLLRRLRHALDLGGVASWLQGLFAGAATVKAVATTAAVVSVAGAVVAAAPEPRGEEAPRTPLPAAPGVPVRAVGTPAGVEALRRVHDASAPASVEPAAAPERRARVSGRPRPVAAAGTSRKPVTRTAGPPVETAPIAPTAVAPALPAAAADVRPTPTGAARAQAPKADRVKAPKQDDRDEPASVDKPKKDPAAEPPGKAAPDAPATDDAVADASTEEAPPTPAEGDGGAKGNGNGNGGTKAKE